MTRFCHLILSSLIIISISAYKAFLRSEKGTKVEIKYESGIPSAEPSISPTPVPTLSPSFLSTLKSSENTANGGEEGSTDKSENDNSQEDKSQDSENDNGEDDNGNSEEGNNESEDSLSEDSNNNTDNDTEQNGDSGDQSSASNQGGGTESADLFNILTAVLLVVLMFIVLCIVNKYVRNQGIVYAPLPSSEGRRGNSQVEMAVRNVPNSMNDDEDWDSFDNSPHIQPASTSPLYGGTRAIPPTS